MSADDHAEIGRGREDSLYGELVRATRMVAVEVAVGIPSGVADVALSVVPTPPLHAAADSLSVAFVSLLVHAAVPVSVPLTGHGVAPAPAGDTVPSLVLPAYAADQATNALPAVADGTVPAAAVIWTFFDQ